MTNDHATPAALLTWNQKKGVLLNLYQYRYDQTEFGSLEYRVYERILGFLSDSEYHTASDVASEAMLELEEESRNPASDKLYAELWGECLESQEVDLPAFLVVLKNLLVEYQAQLDSPGYPNWVSQFDFQCLAHLADYTSLAISASPLDLEVAEGVQRTRLSFLRETIDQQEGEQTSSQHFIFSLLDEYLPVYTAFVEEGRVNGSKHSVKE